MNQDLAQLFISMIVAYEDWGDKVGYTKEEMENLFKKYNFFDEGYKFWNELGSIVLYENKYISRERFCKDMDLEYDDGEFWMLFDDFEDAIGNTTEAKILSGRIWEEWTYSDYHDYDIDWSDFSEKTLEVIKDYLIDNKISIETEDGDLTATIENTKVIKYDILIGEEKLSDHMDDDEVTDLKNYIQWGYSDANEQAEASAAYDKCKEYFEEGFGEWKWKNYKKGDGKEHEMLWVVVSDDKIDRAKEELESSYEWRGKTIYSTEDFGSMYHVLNEYDIIDMEEVNFQYLYSYADDKLIDECVRERVLNN